MVGSEEGSFLLLAVLSGGSANQFGIVSSTSRVLQILAMDAEPPTPVLLEARFTSDGTFVELLFDSQTNQAGFTSTFPCSTLLSFSTISSAVCQFFSKNIIRIFQSTTSRTPFLSLGSEVKLNSGTSLRSLCASGDLTKCSTWASVAETVVIVAVPLNPDLPNVVIGGPSSIGACQNLPLDLTTSTGTAGRPWQRLSITVRRVGSNSGDPDLSSWLRNSYIFSPPSPVPANLMAKGVTYAFTATLVNFLNASSSAVKTVQVTTDERLTPVVAIDGAASRTMARSAALEVRATAFTQSCTGQVSFSNLRFDWLVSLLSGGNRDFNLTALRSLSQNPSIYRLPTFALPTGATYSISVLVSHTSGTSSTSTVSVTLTPGLIVAVIRGGSSMFVNTDVFTSISASPSFDQDVNRLTGARAGLSFAWSCVQTAPIFSSNCNGTLLLATNSIATEEVRVQPVGIDAIGSVSRVSVQVFDSTRSSTAFTDVTVTTERINTIAFSTAATEVTNVPVDQRITLETQVTIVSRCDATWTVDDPNVVLSNAALTPVARSFPLGNFKYNLALATNSLPERATLVFSLKCGVGSSSITVTTNGPPLPGRFSTTPDSGTELNTMFSFVASDWSDPDLPITYLFAFLSPNSGASMTAQGRSQTSFVSTSLPAGKASNGNNITCTVQVFDSYSSSVTVSAVVRVNELDISQQQAAVLDLLSSSDSGSVDSKKGALSVCGSVVNRVNCTLAPDCSTLKREQCEKTDHTCGKCLRSYTGDSGDKNTACLSASDVFNRRNNRRKLWSTQAVECSVDDDCGSALEGCSNGTCVFLNQSCLNNCSGHGSCYYTSVSTRLPVDVCTVDELTCQAVCRCDAGYSGSACSLSDADLAARRSLRQSLVGTLQSVIESDDVSASALSSWSAYFSSVASSPYELSTEGITLIKELAAIATEQSLSSGVDFTHLAGILESVDAILSISMSQYNAEVSAGAGDVSLSNNTAAGIIDILSSFGDLVQQSMVLGQDDVSFVYSNFRIVGQILRAEDALNGTGIAVPSSDVEEAFESTNSGLQLIPLDGIDPETSIAATLIQLYQRSFTASPSTYSFFSDPIRLKIANVDNDTASAEQYLSTIIFSLKNNEALSYFTFGNETSSNFTTQCLRGVIVSETYICPFSGEVIEHHCNGTVAGEYTSFCPVAQPTCAVLNVSLAVASSVSSYCELLSFTPEFTTCACSLLPGADGDVPQRRLYSGFELQATAGEKFVEQSGLVDMATSSEYVAMDFKNTFNAANDLNSAAGARRALVLILLFVILWVFGFLVMAIVHYKEQHAIKTEEDNMLHRGSNIHREQAKRLVANYVQSIIPAVYNKRQTALGRFWNEISLHHRYLYLFCPDTRRADFFDRFRHTMKVLSVETMNIFIQALLFDLQRPSNDGTCVGFLTQSTCLEKTTPLDHTQSYCEWGADSNGNFTCSYQEAQFSQRALLYVIIISTIVTTAFKFPLDQLLKIWACPSDRELTSSLALKHLNSDHAIPIIETSSEREDAAKQKAKESRIVPHITHATQTLASRTFLENIRNLNSVSVSMEKQKLSGQASNHAVATHDRDYTLGARDAPGQVAIRHEGMLGLSEPSAQDDFVEDGLGDLVTDNSNLQRVRVKPNAVKSTPQKTATIHPVNEIKPGESEVHELCKEALELRMTMNENIAETKLFDLQWGVNRDKDFAELTAANHHQQAFMPEATEAFRSSIVAADTDFHKKEPVFPLYNRATAGLELMHLFMIDLMGHKTASAIIFRNKFNEDFEKLRIVPFWLKLTSIAIVVGLNVFFVYWTLLKGVIRGTQWQLELLYTVLIQLVIEVFIFETVECLWLHLVVPESVREDVQKALQVLQTMAERASLYAAVDVEALAATDHGFSAPKFFFVSNKLATLRP
ncbi:hypothetical protein EON64_00125, partial [archaeon]